MKHFIITNRLIEIINEQERIKEDGTEEARDAIRFAEYDTETKNYNIFPEPQPQIPLDRVRYNYQIVDGNDDVLLDENNNQVAINTLHGSVRAFIGLYKSLKQTTEGDVLFFIHGFNTDLNDALDALQNLHEKYVENNTNAIQHIVMFTGASYEPNFRVSRRLSRCRTFWLSLRKSFFKTRDFLSRLFCRERK